MATADYQRTRVRVVRAGPTTAHLSIDAWASGQIAISVPTCDLMEATGLTRRELAGARLTVTANLAATVDTDVDPHDGQLLGRDDEPGAPGSALSAVAA
jgi:hypothetical protein